MGRGPSLGHSHLTARDPLERPHALLHRLERLDVHEEGRRETVLRDEDRSLDTFDVREEFRRLTLPGRDEHGAHGVTREEQSVDRDLGGTASRPHAGPGSVVVWR